MYWIALTDCDGFRIDTVKHVSYEQARNFCGAIKEFAINLGKRDFFLVAYLRTAAITAARAGFPVLRSGRQYLRPVSVFGEPFGPARAGELFGWSRILTDEEALCVINPNGFAPRGADVLVDAQLNLAGSTMTVILNSARTGGAASPGHPVGSQVPVRRTASGAAYVEIRNVDPSEALVLVNRP